MYTTKDIGRTVTDSNGVEVRIVADTGYNYCEECFYITDGGCAANAAFCLAPWDSVGCSGNFHFVRVGLSEVDPEEVKDHGRE